MKAWIAAAVLALVAGSACADTPETQKKNFDRYAPYLQEPVEQFPFWSLYKWQLVGADKVVVWSTIKDAYLLTVEQPCTRLEWAHAIGVTSQQSHFVSRRLDFVTAEQDRCRILEIRPIDSARMQKDKEENAAQK